MTHFAIHEGCLNGYTVSKSPTVYSVFILHYLCVFSFSETVMKCTVSLLMHTLYIKCFLDTDIMFRLHSSFNVH